MQKFLRQQDNNCSKLFWYVIYIINFSYSTINNYNLNINCVIDIVNSSFRYLLGFFFFFKIIFIYLLDCFVPSLLLIPGQSSLQSPILYRKSQDFTISSIIQINCSHIISITNKWIIKSCTSFNCSSQLSVNESLIKTTQNELYIPSKTLSYGIYEFILIVSINALSQLNVSVSSFIEIISSNIIVNFNEYELTTIAYGYEQDLIFNPGKYSINPDEMIFDASAWTYEYYCRIYQSSLLLRIDDLTNSSCLSNSTINKLIFGNLTSSLIIPGNSLQINQTYQFLIKIIHHSNFSIQFNSSLTVTIIEMNLPLIPIGCIISTMCIRNFDYQLVNPSTQIALYSYCIGNCSHIENITWNIYQGFVNESTNETQWILLNQMISFDNIWFFGRHRMNFTSTNQLFLAHPQINHWRFEVVYSLSFGISSSFINFLINQPPSNGSCFIYPQTGTTITVFTINCSNWYDKYGIKDYSLYSMSNICVYILMWKFLLFLAWATDLSQRIMIAFSYVPIFQVRLPSGSNETSSIHLILSIRNLLDSWIDINMSSINITIDIRENSSSISTNHSQFIHLLSNGNQNSIGQMVILLSQQLNQMNNQSLANAISSRFHNRIYIHILCVSLSFFRWYSIDEYSCISIRKFHIWNEISEQNTYESISNWN